MVFTKKKQFKKGPSKGSIAHRRGMEVGSGIAKTLIALANSKAGAGLSRQPSKIIRALRPF